MTSKPGQRELDNLRRLLAMARAEDFGPGDVTGELLSPAVQATATFCARRPMVFCGGAMLAEIAAAYDADIRTHVSAAEGQEVGDGDALAEWSGPARGILAAERVALNFLQKLSAVATTTHAYAAAVAGTGAGIYDTRKTTPGWRDLEKYAVRVGGGCNHRHGLYDAMLIKDNHLAIMARATGGDPVAALGDALQRVRAERPDLTFVELEVDTLEQYAVALTLPVDMILLDNMSPEQMRRAVAMRDGAGLQGCVALEASGGITLDNVRAAAETGVERIAIGALTHSAGSVDIGLDVEIT